MEDTYRSIISGYDEPHYMEITLESFRKMVQALQSTEGVEDGAIQFLAECDQQNIPPPAIVVMEVGQPLKLLTDDQGRLLEFK